jgi:hypothetical protein
METIDSFLGEWARAQAPVTHPVSTTCRHSHEEPFAAFSHWVQSN